MGVFKPHIYSTPPSFYTIMTPLKVKYDKAVQVDSRRIFLFKGLLAPLPSCTVLVQLVSLIAPYMIAFVWTTTCMRGLSSPSNGGRTYSQVRLGKTTNHYPLVGSYNNFPRSCPSPAAP